MACIEFDATFESGNLDSAKLVAELPLEYDLHIRSDTLNARHRVWFFFSARSSVRGQKALLNVVGYSKTKALFREGMAPVVCSASCPCWERMPQGSVYYYRSPRHNKQYVLSFAFTFERHHETYYFAYCFPYTYSYLQRFLHSLDARNLPHYRRTALGRTVQERRLDLVTISSPANLAIDEAIQASNARKPGQHADPTQRISVVFVSSRIHPGETPASYVMHGLLLFLTSDHPAAKALREVLVVKIIPMLNPDGVFLGNYRCNALGLDLNRLWHAPPLFGAPTIHAVRNLAQSYMRNWTCKLAPLTTYDKAQMHSVLRSMFRRQSDALQFVTFTYDPSLFDDE